MILLFCLVFLSVRRHVHGCFCVTLFTVNSIKFLFSTSCIFGGILRPRRRVHVGIILNVRRSLTKTKCGIGRDGVTVNSKNL